MQYQPGRVVVPTLERSPLSTMQDLRANSLDPSTQDGSASRLPERVQEGRRPDERASQPREEAGSPPEPGGNASTVAPSTPLPSPTTFGFTTGQAVMTLVTLIGAILVFQSLRRMNSKGKEAPKPKPTGNLSDLMALRNEIYAKYPPPAKAAQSPRIAVAPADPQLRLVDDRSLSGNHNASHAAEINALRQQIEQLSTEVSHLRSRVLDLESANRSAAMPFGSEARGRLADTANTVISSDHENVYRLADRGMSAVEIAKTLGQHTGQVELILNLRRATGS